LKFAAWVGWLIHQALDWNRHVGALDESWKLADGGGGRHLCGCPGLIGEEGKVWAGEGFIVARKSKALRCIALHWAGRCCESGLASSRVVRVRMADMGDENKGDIRNI